MSSRVRAVAVLLTALMLFATTPVSAEPGKDPNGKSAEAPGQQEDKHGHDEKPGQDPAPRDLPSEWSLNLIVDGLAGVDAEFHRVVREHQEAGIPVTIEPGAGLIDNAPDLEALGEIIDPDLLVLPGAPQPAPAPSSSSAMSEEDCEILILAVMERPPFLDPIVRPECITTDQGGELPLDKLPLPDPGEGGVNLQIVPGKK